MARLEQLPLFPLGLVLFPYERLPLHIFESRYKEMVEHCLEAGDPFGIVFFDQGRIANIGCTARITEVLERYPDGRMDLLVGGERRFQVLELHDDRSYLTADVKLIEEPEVEPQRELQQRVITQHMRLLELAGRTVRPSLYDNVPALSYVIAHNAGLSAQQKQHVLELPSENERIAYLVEHLESFIPRVEQMESLRKKIRSNGHFNDFPPESS